MKSHRQEGVAQVVSFSDNHAYRRRTNYDAIQADSLMTQIIGRAHEPSFSCWSVESKTDSLKSWKQNEFRLSSAGESFSFSFLCTKNTRKRESKGKRRHTEFDPNQSRTEREKVQKRLEKSASPGRKGFRDARGSVWHRRTWISITTNIFFIQYWLFKTRGSAHFSVSHSPFEIIIHARRGSLVLHHRRLFSDA